jgi:hypothetical protein
MAKKRDIYLDACLNVIKRFFGKDPGIGRRAYEDDLYTQLVTPEDGSSAWCFFPSIPGWEDTKQVFMSWLIDGDGKVFVDYQNEVDDVAGMFFETRHPCEPAELLYLMTRPKVYWDRKVLDSEERLLGDLVSFHLLIPAVKPPQQRDIKDVLTSTDSSLLSDIYLNLIGDWNAAVEGRLPVGVQFAEKWGHWIKGSASADQMLAEGYVLGSSGHLRWAACLPHPSGDTVLLAIRLKDGVSGLFMREYMNTDAVVQAQITNAYVNSSNLNELIDNLKSVTCTIPKELPDQIRVAAEVNAMQAAVVHKARWIATSGGKSFADTLKAHAELMTKMDQLFESLEQHN